nr:MAG TPA: hypothetical protein [Caudoviricetes sp.]
MKCFKGFEKDLKCRDFQYEEGKEFHAEKADCCNDGFHACEYPLDCFAYYDPAHNVFHEVELSGEMNKDGNDTKVCATDIKIGARISIAGLVKAAIEFTMSKVNKEGKSDERHGFASATGYRGASSVSNPTGVAVAWGHEAKAKGCLGAHLILSDWRYIGEKRPDGEYKNPYKVENWEFAGAKMIQVDGENIKEDTFYTLKDGKFVEAD